MSAEPTDAHLYSLPNILTYGRIVAVPVMAACFFLGTPLEPTDTARWIAFGLFSVAAVTDYLDGYLARRWQQVSAMGRMLDPIADKLLVSVALLLLVGDGTIGGWSLWAAIIILCREILVSGLREYLAGVRVSVPVSQLAKWKTALQLVAIALLIAGPAGDAIVPSLSIFGIALLWVSAIITIYTGWDYFRASMRHVTGG